MFPCAKTIHGRTSNCLVSKPQLKLKTAATNIVEVRNTISDFKLNNIKTTFAVH